MWFVDHGYSKGSFDKQINQFSHLSPFHPKILCLAHKGFSRWLSERFKRVFCSCSLSRYSRCRNEKLVAIWFDLCTKRFLVNMSLSTQVFWRYILNLLYLRYVILHMDPWCGFVVNCLPSAPEVLRWPNKPIRDWVPPFPFGKTTTVFLVSCENQFLFIYLSVSESLILYIMALFLTRLLTLILFSFLFGWLPV